MIAAMLAVFLSTTASAQNAMVLDRIRALDAAAKMPAKADLEAAILSTANTIADAKKVCRPAAINSEDVAPITGAAAILPAVLNCQIKNAWSVYVRYAGCQAPEPFRYAVLQLPDGSLKALLVNEGHSFANLSIMRDTSANAAVAALQRIKQEDANCAGADMAMGATRVASQSQDLGPDLFGVRYVGSWTETWDFTTCGRTARVPIEFKADGDGGAYTHIKGDAVTLASTGH
jgi:hypothetical protein